MGAVGFAAMVLVDFGKMVSFMFTAKPITQIGSFSDFAIMKSTKRVLIPPESILALLPDLETYHAPTTMSQSPRRVGANSIVAPL